MQTISIMKTFRADFTADVLLDGQIQDLTGYTAKFIMIDTDGNLKIDSPAAIIDEAAGKVSYSPTVADVDTEGEYTAYFALAVWWVNQIAAPTEKYLIKILPDWR